MKILVAAIAQPNGISGVQRHALNLVRCLLQHPEITAVHLALAPWQLHLPRLAGLNPEDRLRIEIARVKRSSVDRNLWHLYDLPGLAREVKADLVHLSYPVPFRRAAMPCPVAMTLHDLYPFEIPSNFGFPQVVVNRMILRSALRQADAISCVSRTTLGALYSSGLRTTAPCSVIPNCVEPRRLTALSSPLTGWNGETFLLTVAQHRRNKNLDLLLRSFCGLVASARLQRTARLVLVGMPGPETQTLQDLAKALDISSRVDFLTNLSDPELQWCYKHCTALVAPSSIEGFGLPVVEARLAGCRVVCSDIPAFREFAGPQARFVNLHGNAERDLYLAIAEVLTRRRPLPEHLPQFGVSAVGKRYVDFFRTTLSQQTTAVRSSSIAEPFKERHIV